MKVTVQSPHIEVTIEQAKTWLLRNGYAALPDKAIDSHGFRHIEYGEVVLVPKEGCFQEARRMSLTIEGISKMTGRHAIDILREMSEVQI